MFLTGSGISPIRSPAPTRSLPAVGTPVAAVGTPAVSASPAVPAQLPQPALSVAPRRGPAVCPGSPTFCRCSECTTVVPAAAVVTPVRPSLDVVVERLAECLDSPLDPGWHQFAFEPLVLAPSALCKNLDSSDNIDSP